MQNPGSKELYMMNGGQTLYIYKDGFGDIYKASAAEEAEWAKEVVENNLLKIELEQNRTQLQFAIAGLQYHKYEMLEELLLKKIPDTTPVRQIVFATALWNMIGYEKSFPIIYHNFQRHRNECLADVFLALNDFKHHETAKRFLVNCLQGDDVELVQKAQMTISMWAWSGIPALRENNLTDLLLPSNKNNASFKAASETLRKILGMR